MNEKFYRLLPKALALTLVAAIILVALSIVNNTKIPAQSGFTPIDPAEKNVNNNDDENEDIIPEPYYTVFPKQAKASADFLYEQELSGYGNIVIKNLLQTTDSLYAVLECDTLFGDITTVKKAVAVAKMSLLGIVEKILALPSRLDACYLCSKLTAENIVIMAKTAENVLIFDTVYDLSGSETSTLPLAQGGRLFLTMSGCIMLTEGQNNTVYVRNGELQTGFLPSGEILEIYDFYHYLLIIINTDTGYSIVKLSPSLKILQSTVIEGCKAVAITPFAEGGEQKFLVAEKSSAGTKLWKYTVAFNRLDADSAVISDCDELKLLPHGDKILAVFSGSTRGIYLFNKDLECALANVSALQNINEIYGYILYNNGCYLLADSYDGLNLIDYRYDNTHTVNNVSDESGDAFFCQNPNNTLSVFYNFTETFNSVKITALHV